MDPKLEQAVQAIKSGDKSAGLVLIAQVIRSDPNNESAWIWMATAQDDPEKKKQCLERVLHINPGNERVRRALSVMFPPVVSTEQIPPTSVAVPEPQPVPPDQPTVMEMPSAESGTAEAIIPAEADTTIPSPVEIIPPAVSQAEAAPLETQPSASEPGSMEVAGPDLSWLKETASVTDEVKEEASDLSWLKEDLPTEETEQELPTSPDTLQAVTGEPLWQNENIQPAESEEAKEEPAPDLSWLREDQSTEPGHRNQLQLARRDRNRCNTLRPVLVKEETPAAGLQEPQAGIPPAPTGEIDDLAWLRAASADTTPDLSSAGKPTPNLIRGNRSIVAGYRACG